jgi:hypothetical protein
MMCACSFNMRRVCVPPAASAGPVGAKRSRRQISANRHPEPPINTNEPLVAHAAAQ